MIAEYWTALFLVGRPFSISKMYSTDITECKESTCSDNGECLEIDGEGTRCICKDGYTSKDCSESKSQ